MDLNVEEQLLLDRFKYRYAENTEKDFEIYFQIKSDSKAIEFSGFKTAPDKEKFRLVFQKIFEDNSQHLLFFIDTENNDEVCSTFHYRDVDEETVEGLGYNVFPEYRGNRLGWLMMHTVNELSKNLGFKYRLSYVAESNLPSIKNLEKSGAKPTGKYTYRRLEALKKEEKFLEYITEL